MASDDTADPPDGEDGRVLAYPEWCLSRLRQSMRGTTLVLMSMVAAFAVRDWLVAPAMAAKAMVFRGLGIAVVGAMYVLIGRARRWNRAYAAALTGLVLFLATHGAVLSLAPYGFRYGLWTAMLIPLVVSVLVTRVWEVVLVQVVALAIMQLVLAHARPDSSEWSAAEAAIVLSACVTTFLGWFSCRARREQFRLESRLRDEANRDALTGLVNRRHLFGQGAIEVQRARRYLRPLSVVVFDIDHFKGINDRHGHAAGDAVIQSTANVLASAVRETDTPARIGGEEFVLLLPETTDAAAMTLAERLRLQIASTTVANKDSPMTWTVSAGVATLLEGDRDLHDVIKRADAGLYESKRRGRNLVSSVRPQPMSSAVSSAPPWAVERAGQDELDGA